MDIIDSIGGMLMILRIYVTMMPLIFGGILNMLFTKTVVYKQFKSPIDMGLVLSDGKRLFGDNKTWIGFFSMILFCVISQICWGFVCKIDSVCRLNDLYSVFDNTILFNCLSGFLIGVVYMICELPNSFIKRRLNIDSGKTDKGIKGVIFFVIDQIDSLLGVFALFCLFTSNGMNVFMCYLLVGALTHIIINLILYKLRVRRNV